MQAIAVQRLPDQTQLFFGAAVDLVARHRMVDVGM